MTYEEIAAAYDSHADAMMASMGLVEQSLSKLAVMEEVLKLRGKAEDARSQARYEARQVESQRFDHEIRVRWTKAHEEQAMALARIATKLEGFSVGPDGVR